MFRRGRALLAVASIGVLLMAACGGTAPKAAASPSASAAPTLDPNYFAGKTIRMLVAGNPGTGIDLNARLVGTYLAKHLPGNPTITYTAMPGGSGVQVGNTMSDPATAKPDGLTIGAPGPGLALYQVTKVPGVTYDASKFEWIGGPPDPDGAIWVRTTTGVKKADDMKTVAQTIVFGGGQKSNPSFVVPELLRTDAKWNARVIGGLGAGPEIALSFDRGDTSAGYGAYYAQAQLRPDWFKDKTVTLIARNGNADKSGALTGLPQVADLLPKEAASIMALVASGVGRPVMAPPGTPANIMKAYADAMAKAAADPAFIAEATQKGVEPSLLTGAQDLEIAKKILATPPEIVDRFQKLTN